MKALLLAAGLGTRLRPLTNHMPKCLVPINGRPLLDYWFALLLNKGIDRVLINTHYLSEQVEQYIKSCHWRDYIDLVHEEKLYGTGGTLLRNADYFEGKAFFVAHADNLTWFDFDQFFQSHLRRAEAKRTPISMMTFETDRPEACGIVTLNEKSQVICFEEKSANPSGRIANGAIYIFEPEVLSFLKHMDKVFIDLSTEVLPHFMGRIHAFHNGHYLRDIGTAQSLGKAECDVIQRSDFASLF